MGRTTGYPIPRNPPHGISHGKNHGTTCGTPAPCTTTTLLGAPALVKKTKPGDPPQVRVEPVVPIPSRKQNCGFGGRALTVQAPQKMVLVYHGTKHRLWGVRFTWFQYVPFSAQMEQLYVPA